MTMKYELRMQVTVACVQQESESREKEKEMQTRGDPNGYAWPESLL